jgi:nitrogen fixation NifU-like protein
MGMPGIYTEKVMEHFRNPRNMGEIPDADGLGTAGNPVCGDKMFIYIKVADDKIKDIKFKTFGCGAAVATSSMVTELAKGKPIRDALKISRKDVADALGGLPAIKMHCSNLAADALKVAIFEWMNKDPKAKERFKDIYPDLEKVVADIRAKEAAGEDHGEGEGDTCAV